MTTHDAINAVFEGGGAIFLCLNVRRLLKDKSVKGVSLLTTSWWTTWGFWNVYFYSAVNTPASFYAGIAVVIVNAVWLGLALWFARPRRVKPLMMAAGSDLDSLGLVLNAPRIVETDADYRSRLHDLACGMAGCP
jgi:hypothetical protein